MKRVGVSLVFVLLFFGAYAFHHVNASDSHWDGSISINEVGEIEDAAVNYPQYCEQKPTSVVKLPQNVYGDLSNNLRDLYTEPTGEHCIVKNAQGSFTFEYSNTFGLQRHISSHFNPDNNLQGLLNLEITSRSLNWLEPAPQGLNVLELDRGTVFNESYQIAVHKNIREWGRVEGKGKDVIWTRDQAKYDGVAQLQKLQHQDGGEFKATLHRFSPNGRFLLVRSTEGLVLVDLIDYTRTFVLRVSTESGHKPLDFAVSNDGKYVAYTDITNNLELIDTSSCELVEKWGSWQKRFVHKSWAPKLYQGCESVKNFKNSISQAGLFTVNAQIRRLYFDAIGSELYFSLKSSAWTAENPVHDYSWKEYKIVAEDYVSSAAGYLAMGDSFSSGEGDLEGEIWYEPGTDEHGDKTTFAGRNLCHLSRRSYPYLIALELGYLADNQSSPPADGLFHSVACSGAKIHNIIGGVLGENQIGGREEDFTKTDNQYVYNTGFTLGLWHPGNSKQLSSLLGWSSPDDDKRVKFAPEVVTLGIGGNDAGFGDFLTACVLGGTCDHAINNTNKATNLGVRIAQQKTRLVNTYKELKKESPDARVYVHGYPVFVRSTGGSCALNVRLNDQERQFAANAIEYMNRVVKAAATEAGVYYVDITDIFEGGRLCDEGAKYVNGATAGDDKLRILGNESFHPNQDGFLVYKDAILRATDNLSKPIPVPSNTDYPLPNINLFGERAFYMIHAMNQNYQTKQMASTPESFIVSQDNKEVSIKQANLYPNSVVNIEAQSDPINLGNYVVDEKGTLTVTIPQSGIAPGYHELHLFGFNSYGEPIDYYQPLFIPFSEADLDGDGVLDSEDSCLTLPNSSVDKDGDGIDDGCDLVVTPAAVNVNSQNYNPRSTPAGQEGGNSSNNGPASSQEPTSAAQNTPLTSSEGEIGSATTSQSFSEGQDSDRQVLGLSAKSQTNSLNEVQKATGVQWWVITLILTASSITMGLITKYAYAKNIQ